MSDSGVEAGSDADSLGEMSVGSSASSNDGINPHIIPHHQEQHIQVDDNLPDHQDQGQHIPQQQQQQQQPQQQQSVHLLPPVIAVGVSSANQQQIHLPVTHQSDSDCAHSFRLQMPNEFNHSFQFNQQVNQPSQAQAELLESDSNDVYGDVEITFNNSYSTASCDGKTDDETTRDNDDEPKIRSFRHSSSCNNTKTPAPSPTTPPIQILKPHYPRDHSSNSPGPSSSSSSSNCQKNLFADLSWNHSQESNPFTYSSSVDSAYQNDWCKFNNRPYASEQFHGARSMTDMNDHEQDESLAYSRRESNPSDLNGQHEYYPKIRIKKKLWSSRARKVNVFGPEVYNKKLQMAANMGDVESVKKFLELGADPCSFDIRSRTSLHFAACKGEIRVAQLLLDHGADPNLQDVLGNTPLHLAACTNNTSMVTLLLKYGTDVTVLDKSGRTPLHLAESKLKILQSPSVECSSSPTNLKMQVLQVIEMIQIYLEKSGKHAAADALGKFTNRIHSHQTKHEVDMDVQDLLASLNHMSLG